MPQLNIASGLTRKERRQLVRASRKEDTHRNAGQAVALEWIKFVFPAILVIAIAVLWSGRPVARQDPLDQIIARNGLHWHANLGISIKGKKQDIPSGVGLGAVHLPVHTHDEEDTIHMEFQGRVREKDLLLGQFFKNWDRTLSSTCLFDACNGRGGTLRMLVNGELNFDFENYRMRDGDKIEIIYD